MKDLKFRDDGSLMWLDGEFENGDQIEEFVKCKKQQNQLEQNTGKKGSGS